MKKTYFAKAADVENNWYVVDATDVVLGRLASQVAIRLRGKHKATYTPHMHDGDNIIVINADKVKLTGKKVENKKYYRHTGYPGGIKETTPEKILEGKTPEKIVKLAVLRMLPKEGALRRQQFKSLYVYAGEQHPHEGQKPQTLDIAGKNPKNKRPNN